MVMSWKFKQALMVIITFLKAILDVSPRSEKHLRLFNLEDKLEDQSIKECVIK